MMSWNCGGERARRRGGAGARRLGAGWALIAGAGLGLLASAEGRATSLDFVLVTSGSEQVKSLVQATNGDKKSYPATAFSVDVDLDAGTIQISDFAIPDVDTFNTRMSFSAPAQISGTLSEIAPGTGVYEVTFASLMVPFTRDSISGTLQFDLSTHDTSLSPGNGCGLAFPLTLEGSHLDVVSGYMELVGGVCPYGGASHTFSDGFRLFVRGNFTTPLPEPGTGVQLVVGLASLFLAQRRRAGTRSPRPR